MNNRRSCQAESFLLKKVAALALLFSFALPVFPTIVEAAPEETLSVEENESTPEDILLDKQERTLVTDEMPPTDEEQDESEIPQMESFTSGEPLEFQYLAGQSHEKNGLPSSDRVSGGLTYSYLLTVPPGRNGLQPQLQLSYSSQDTALGSIVGQGWKVDIPYIQRINRLGTENLYSTTSPYFTSSVSGELATTSVANTYYAKEDNGSFIRYVLSGNQWLATDKQGTTYRYGYATSSRQDNATGTKTYRWMLEEVRDTNGNFIRYEYAKDSGQIYPEAVYYTGNGTTDGIFKVEFAKALRTDISTSTEAGFDIVSKYRLTDIKARINGAVVRTYNLGYGVGDNGVKSLLDSITESGITEQGATTTLPAVEFSYATSSKIFMEDESYEVPDYFAYNGSDMGVRILDINGDGYPDILRGHEGAGPAGNRVYLNEYDGTGWGTTASSTLPTYFVHGDKGVRFADLNGDGYTDILRSECNSIDVISDFKVFLNDKNLGWTDDTASWTIPQCFAGSGYDKGTRLADVNGDGYPDIIKSRDSGLPSDKKVYLHTRDGTGWQEDTNYSIPIYFAKDGYDLGTRLVDVNSDGLVDIVQSASGGSQPGQAIYFNKGDGTGWASSTPWNVPTYIYISGTVDPGVRFADINNDGLIDWLQANGAGQGVYLNTGKGFVQDASSTIPYIFMNENSDQGVMIEDVDADGSADYIQSKQAWSNPAPGWPNIQHVALNAGHVPDLLTAIEYPAGGSTNIAYQSAAHYKDDSGNLLNPSIVSNPMTVVGITHSPGMGEDMTETYEYAGGDFYRGSYLDRKFSGFGSIKKTDSSGFTTTDFFHQGNATASTTGEYDDVICKLGRIYRTEVRDDGEDLFSLAVNKWDRTNLESGRCFLKLTQSTQLEYDGDVDHADKAVTYVYDDTTGNMVQKIEWGAVLGGNDGSFSDTGSDKLMSGYTYAASSTGYLVGLESQASTTNQSGIKIAETRRYYDNQSLGTVLKGNGTKTEYWRTGSSYASTTQTYDSTYGVMTSSANPRAKTTIYTLDSYNLYPATTTDPANFATGYTYDYSSGKVKLLVDSNLRQFETAYDGFDRPLLEKQPDIATPTTLITRKTYAYTDTSGAKKTLETNHLDGSNEFVLYTYLDGLDRKIQTRKEAEVSNQFSVRDFRYDANGLLWKESLPYFSNGSSRTSATGNGSLYTTYVYDALKRIVSIQNAVGTTENRYDQRTVTTTDAEGNEKDFSYDTYGNLVEVVEYGDGSYTTEYEYDGNRNLTKITDAENNIRNFTYDGLSRRLTAEDIHDAGDGTFGTWTYVYDDAGNLISQIDPRSQTITFTYDDVNRVLTEDYAGQGGTEITYAYDSCFGNRTSLCTATTTDMVTHFTYNALALPATEKKTINGSAYTMTYAYDRQGNVTNLIHPDNSEVQYVYNTAGLLETVQYKNSGESFADIVIDFDYAPTEKITFKQFSNGAETTYTHAASALYRLMNIRTILSEGESLLDEGGTGGLSFDPNLRFALAPIGTWSQAEFVPEESTEPIVEITEPTPPSEPEESVQVPEPEVTIPPTATTTEPVDLPEVPAEAGTSTIPITEEPTASSTEPQLEEVATTTEVIVPVLLPQEAPVPGLRAEIEKAPVGMRATLKGQEIAKVVSVGEFTDGEFRIEVTGVEAIEDGVQVFARAWKDGQQLGFGRDGTVDIERFRFFNPPVLVPDEEGDIIIESYSETRGSAHIQRFREDPLTALQQALFQVVSRSGREGVSIRQGSRGNTISTFYSEADPASVAGDARIANNGAGGVSYTTIQNATAGSVVENSGQSAEVNNLKVGTAYRVSKFFVAFSTSAIPDTDMIASSTISYYAFDKGDADSDSFSVVAATPASATTYITGDFDQASTTKLATDIPVSSVSTSAYTNFLLNSSGRANVSATDTSKFAFRLAKDISATQPTGITYIDGRTSDVAGTTNDPKLTVEHYTNVAPSEPTSLLSEGQVNPATILDSTPELSAIYQDADIGDTAMYYQIQVATSTSFASTTWDSTKITLASSTPSGMRIADISYAGPALASSTTYYWRIKFWDSHDFAGSWSTTTASFALALWAPSTAPLNLQVDGQTNPVGITNTTPDFSAIFDDPDSADLADSYQIQVATTSGSWAALKWDSGKLSVASSTPVGQRVSGMPYSGTVLLPTDTYYWRLKFWDNHDVEGTWSTTTATFTTNTLPPTDTIQDLYFIYDDVGNITQLRDYGGTGSGKIVQYDYDNLYRLTSASTTAASSSPYKHVFSYTSIGNLSSSTPGGAYVYVETGTTNPHAATSVGGTTLGYDANGNLTSYGTDTYAFDYRNRLASSTTSGTGTTYAYDHSMQRVSRTSNGVTTVYPNSFFTKAGATTTKSIYAGGELVATVEGNGTATTTRFVHNDHLNSTNVVTSSEGNLVQVLDYMPFGEKRIGTGEDVSQREFLSQVEDPSTSMNYLNNRYLQNDRGQFISQDAMFWALPAQLLLDPQQQNAYSYARNNPISMSDPSGLLTIAVPGTKTRNDGKTNGSEWTSTSKGKQFLNSLEKTFGETPYVLPWSGGNSRSARTEGATMLAEKINGYTFAKGEKLNIVGYSHGGNVAIEASNMKLNHQINNLVTLGTPARTDYRPNYASINNHVNVSNFFDVIQTGAGTNGYAVLGSLVGPTMYGSQLGSVIGATVFPNFELGFAGQTYSGAKNVDATWSTTGLFPTDTHGNLWRNTSTWTGLIR